ncbi:MAG: hypothetical protein MH132_08330 [Hydrotalea sp.]|nr:hypothetical protein [Hydrotalea sp.]
MRKFTLFFVWIVLMTANTNDLFAQVLVASKGNRVLQFEKDKKYHFMYFDSAGMPVSIKARLSFIGKDSLVLTGKKKTVQIPLRELFEVSHYRSTGAVIGASAQFLAGSALSIALLNNGESGFVRGLLIATGGLYAIDAILQIAGVSTIGSFAAQPNIRRGFTFKIK